MTDIAILGAGAFGTSLAISLARAGQKVHLIPRGDTQVALLEQDRENKQRLPGVAFPDSLNVTAHIPDKAGIVLAAIPTQVMADYLTPLAPILADRVVVTCNKGIDLKTGLGPAGIVRVACPDAKVAVLSGPGFAQDIARNLPTAMTLACTDEERGQQVQQVLSTPTLRLYLSTDVTGVEMGGALKNVIAIAAGLVAGAQLGESARAAIITRGYAELTRFALARGAEAETLAGLSGLGDLVLTCTSPTSRNYAHGQKIGAGEVPDRTKTVEGAATAGIVATLARELGVEVPITEVVNKILNEEMDVMRAQEILFARPLRKE